MVGCFVNGRPMNLNSIVNNAVVNKYVNSTTILVTLYKQELDISIVSIESLWTKAPLCYYISVLTVVKL